MVIETKQTCQRSETIIQCELYTGGLHFQPVQYAFYHVYAKSGMKLQLHSCNHVYYIQLVIQSLVQSSLYGSPVCALFRPDQSVGPGQAEDPRVVLFSVQPKFDHGRQHLHLCLCSSFCTYRRYLCTLLELHID